MSVSDIISQVQKFYNEAGEYFSKTRQRKHGANANWHELYPYLQMIEDGDSVLDVGCGNGRLLTGMDKDIDYVGVDFSETLLSEARKLHPESRFIYGDVTKSSIWEKVGDRKFDFVFCVAVLHHIPTKKQQLYVLKEMKKRLKKGGLLYISVWNLWQKRYMKYHLKPTLKTRDLHWVYIPFMKRWDRFCFAFTKNNILELMRESDIDVKDVFYSGASGVKTNVFNGRNLVVVGSIR